MLNELVRRHFEPVATAVAEDAREQALSLRTGPPAVPLLRTLRRVRADVALLGRAMAFQLGKVAVTTSEAVARYFGEAAAFLRGIGWRPRRNAGWCDGHDATQMLLGFSLMTLRRASLT